MCGIAGILTDPGAPIEAGALERMDRSLAHRGPDDAGVWLRPGGGAGFAHRRLAILDLSAAGHQPYVDDRACLAMTYNGEIYNFRELRRDLEARGRQFRSQSDTEVILAGYALHGPAFVERLRGMFAFALWDERERICLLARDRFGIKPLYYATAGGRLVFASEVRALAASGLVSTELDPAAVQRYLQAGSVAEPATLLREVRALEAGTTGMWRDGRLDTRRYWSIGFAPEAIDWPTAVARTRAALADSVTHHFVSDVPVGIFLSGGIDSTALVALARSTGVTDLHTFCVSMPGHPNDEGPAARRSAQHFGTTHHEWPIDGVSGRTLLQSFVASVDQPTIDGFNSYVVSKCARESGMKVVLSGVGGDELFGGYKSFRQVPKIAAAHRLLQSVGLNGVAGTLIGSAGSARWRRMGASLRAPASLTTTYAAFRGVFTADEARILTARLTGAEPVAQPLDTEPAATGGDAISELELTRYMRNQLLRDADTMSMAWGLELRVPFLDAALFDALRGIPAALRLRERKGLLRAAVPELPEWVTRPGKRGFLFPFEDWMAGEWTDLFTAIERTSPVPMETWYRTWCVFMIERWMAAVRGGHG